MAQIGMRHWLECLAVLCITLAQVSMAKIASAAEIETVKFHDALTINGQKMVLNNVGLMRYKLVIKAMVAALYLEPNTAPADVLSDVPKRLEIEYFWAIKGKDIVSASEALLVDNVSAQKIRELRKEFDYVNSLYPDIKAGDRFELTYLPGVGTQLSLNGKPRGLIPGKEFAAAYFSIWLGAKPMDMALRDQLLKTR